MPLIVGFLFGYIGSIPLAGPISLLVLAYGLAGRLRGALAVAAGGAVAEGAYAYAAFRGLTGLFVRYPDLLPYSRAAGALVLLGLGGYFAFGQKDASSDPDAQRASKGGDLALGFTLSALNPTLLVTWTAAASTLYSTGWLAPSSSSAVPFSLGAAAGIVAWFATLLALVSRYRERFRPALLARVVRLLGGGLMMLGAYFAWLFARFLLALARGGVVACRGGWAGAGRRAQQGTRRRDSRAGG